MHIPQPLPKGFEVEPGEIPEQYLLRHGRPKIEDRGNPADLEEHLLVFRNPVGGEDVMIPLPDLAAAFGRESINIIYTIEGWRG